MNRRRLLQAFAAATFAAVVEVTGLTLKTISLPENTFEWRGVTFAIQQSLPRYQFTDGKYIRLEDRKA